MFRKRRKKVTLTDEEVDSLGLFAFLLDNEADNIEQVVPDAIASPLSQETVSGQPTISEMLHALADWLRGIISRISMFFL